jgi:hypothetical protein
MDLTVWLFGQLVKHIFGRPFLHRPPPPYAGEALQPNASLLAAKSSLIAWRTAAVPPSARIFANGGKWMAREGQVLAQVVQPQPPAAAGQGSGRPRAQFRTWLLENAHGIGNA